MISPGSPTPCITAATKEWIGLMEATTLTSALADTAVDAMSVEARSRPLRRFMTDSMNELNVCDVILLQDCVTV
jgi:hypothetical protein